MASSNGMTVYTFTKDTKDSGKSACNGGCAGTWPPLTVAAGATPTGDTGVTGKIGTITRDDGTRPGHVQRAAALLLQRRQGGRRRERRLHELGGGQAVTLRYALGMAVSRLGRLGWLAAARPAGAPGRVRPGRSNSSATERPPGRRRALVEERVELEGVVAQPALPEPVIRAGDATTAQKRGPWPNTRKWASSWMTTVSSASGGARISRQLNDSRPARDALPQRVRWSRIETAVGLTPRAAAWSPGPPR